MCDLWKNTLTRSVPPGAVPAQIDYALSELAPASWSAAFPRRFGSPTQIKLYNSGSFFDPAAIPPSDHPAIANRLAFARNTVVESHPRLINSNVLRFRDLLSGSLEVSMGLETIDPQVYPRLNKRFTLKQFSNAAQSLRSAKIAVRVFILVNPPFVSLADSLEWTVRSAQFAFDCGANVVSLIPTRPGNGAMDALLKSGDFIPPTLNDLEIVFEQTLALRRGRVFADTWDLEKFSHCPSCFKPRSERLHQANLTQQLPPPTNCPVCRNR